MADEAIHITMGTGMALMLIKQAWEFLGPRLSASKERAADSGGKDPSYWKQEFRAAIDEKLDQRIIPILEGQQKILESQARTQEGVAKLVEELVDVSRKRRTR